MKSLTEPSSSMSELLKTGPWTPFNAEIRAIMDKVMTADDTNALNYAMGKRTGWLTCQSQGRPEVITAAEVEMTTPQWTKVVRIGRGEVEEVAIQKMEGRSRHYIWFPENLNKDGGFPRKRMADGFMISVVMPRLSDYAIYSENRETEATVLRAKIEQLNTQVGDAQDKLMALYVDEDREEVL
jgi:6-phosphofructokinase